MEGEAPGAEAHRELARHHVSRAALRAREEDFDPCVIVCGKALEAAYRYLVLHMVEEHDLRDESTFMARADDKLGRHWKSLEERIEDAQFVQCIDLLRGAFGERIDAYRPLAARPLHEGGPPLKEILDSEEDWDVVKHARNLAAHSTSSEDDPFVPHRTSKETAIRALRQTIEVAMNLAIVTEGEGRELRELEPVTEVAQLGTSSTDGWPTREGELAEEVVEVPSIDRLAGHLERFVREEESASRVQTAWRWDKPLDERVEDGYAIADLEVAKIVEDKLGNKKRLHLTCEENLSRFREGGSLLLSFDEPENACPCTLVRDDEHELVVEQRYYHEPSFEALALEERTTGLTLDKDHFDSDVRSDVVDRLRKATPAALRVFEVLAGERLPTENPGRETDAVEALSLLQERIDLDPTQKQAISAAIKEEPYSIIHGPPGTGKTRVLAALAAGLALKGERVLLTAFTNRAVDNALQEIHELGFDDVPSFKIAGKDRWPEDLPAYATIEEAFEDDIEPTQGFVVAATPFTLGGRRLTAPAGGMLEFDQIAVDEASQLDLVLGSHLLLTADRVTFVGDHNQTAPIIQSSHDPGWLERSIFDVLQDHEEGILLENTYRLNEELAAFPSETFYEGQIQAAGRAEKRRLPLEQNPSSPYERVLDPEIPVLTCEIPHRGCRQRSEAEARHVAAIVGEAVECGIEAEDILVVTPFRAQERMLRQHLQEQAQQRKDFSLHGVPVATVDRAQGREFEMAIYSLTTSDEEYAKRTTDFLFDQRRLNVATTRARSKCITVLSPSLARVRIDPSKVPGVSVLRRFVEETPSIELNPAIETA